MLFRSAKMSLFELDNRPRSFALNAPTVLLFGLEGELEIAVYPGEEEYGLAPGDTLCIGAHVEERVVFLDPGKGRAKLAAIEIAQIRVKSQS